MVISTDDMRMNIQEWFAQARDVHELVEVAVAVKMETEKQIDFMVREFCEEWSVSGNA